MKIRSVIFIAAATVLAATPLLLSGWPGTTALSGFTGENDPQSSRTTPGKGGFEVWIADQSDTRPGFGGQLLIYEGSHLMGRRPAGATPIARLDLGAETADLCR